MSVRVRWLGSWTLICGAGLACSAACGESTHNGGAGGAGSAGNAGVGGGAAAGSGTAGTGGAGSSTAGAGGGEPSGGMSADDAGGQAGAGGAVEEPALTCASAEKQVGYLGCDFWPTFVSNPVWSTFSPGVVLANEGRAGDPSASVTIDGPSGFHQVVDVAPGKQVALELPWVTELKGPEWSSINTSGGRSAESRRVDGGAYHVQSSSPIAVWQLNPLHQQQSGSGCPKPLTECRSASNDGSLLLPTRSLTGNYRIFTYSGKNDGDDWGSVPGGFAVTATIDGTQLTIQTALHCGTELEATSALGPCTAPGPNLPAKSASELIQLSLNAGDVVQIVGAKAAKPTLKHADLSGSLVSASQPVQVISFAAVANIPDYSVANSDHLEEALPPTESLDNRYVVVPPSSPTGPTHGHVVRIYGHVDGTHLTYPEGKPSGAPDVINAGEVVQIPPLPPGAPAPSCLTVSGNCVLTEPFVITGDQSFAVASLMPGGVLQSPGTDATSSTGDPSLAFAISPRQFRQSFTFFVPADYVSSWLDVLAPNGAAVLLDNVPLAQTPEPVGKSDWSVVRVPVAAPGLHRVETGDARGVGGTIATFAFASALYYSGGADQKRITQPAVIVP